MSTAPSTEAAELPRAPRVPDVHTPEGRYRSGMLRRVGLIHRLLGLNWILRRLSLEEQSVENIRQATAKGPVIYVLHTRSRLDFLALNRVLNSRRLPLARFCNGVTSTLHRPFIDAVKEWVHAAKVHLSGGLPEPVESGWLASAIAGGMTSALFLLQPRSTRQRMKGGHVAPDPVVAMIRAQEQCERPIQIVPVVVIWQRRPEVARTQVGRFILGAQDEPGPLQKLFSVLTRNNRAVVQVGKPLELPALLARMEGEPPARTIRATRILLRRYLYRESHTVRGPRIRPPSWTRRLVLQSPEIRSLIEEEAKKRGKSQAKIRIQVEKTLDHIAARMSFTVVRAAAWGCRFLFNRIFAGVDWREEETERIRDAIREGTPVLVPCHRSHLDYLLMSSQCYEHDLVIPHIVAGENLAFFPVGPIFRRLGAFFIQRSFKGSKLFPVVFDRYMRQLVRDGFMLEFFIEGGRSRTGKMLPPKLGVLGMILDAAWGGREDRNTTLLPVAISYEEIAEEKAYAKELAGATKETESVGQVVRAHRVLSKRFGRVYVRMGEPILVREIFEAGRVPWPELDREHRKELLQLAGEKLTYRIAQQMVVLPTGLVSLALLSQSRRGIRMGELSARVNRFVPMLRRMGAQSADSLQSVGWAVAEALKRFEKKKMIARLSDAEGEIIRVVDERRITLDYYKNGLVHFVAPVSMLAAAVKAVGDEGALDVDEVLRLFRLQEFLFRYEFTSDPECSVEDSLGKTFDELVAYGALRREGEAYFVADRQLVGELAGVLGNFRESYLLVLSAARTLRSRDIAARLMPERVFGVGKGLLAVDEITRPEALNMANLKNAVRAYREEGLLTFRVGGGGVQFDEDAWAQYTQDLRRML